MWGQGAVCIREFEEFSNCVQMIQSNADMCQAWQKKKKIFVTLYVTGCYRSKSQILDFLITYKHNYIEIHRVQYLVATRMCDGGD